MIRLGILPNNETSIEDKDSADWHRADIIAAVKKRGTSIAALSRKEGLSSTTLSNALMRPWPKGELIIAQAIGCQPEEIWPSRYKKKRRLRKPK